MKRRETKTPSSFWLETPAKDGEARTEKTRAVITAGFLSRPRGGTRLQRLAAFLSRGADDRQKGMLQERFVDLSLSREEYVLAQLRRREIFEFAAFYYAIDVLGLTAPEDSLVLLDFQATRAPAGPFFDDFELLRLEEIWRDRPGAFEPSMLARFLAPAMPEAVAHHLVDACESAGFLARRTVRNAVVVTSIGMMEEVLADCLRDARLNIGDL